MPEEPAAERAERLLITRILEGVYPPGSELPGQRDLAKELEVARPALREALSRLSADGWIDIQHGKSTRVNDFRREGTLTTLVSLLRIDPGLLPDFIPNLLEFWGILAPVYTRSALQNNPQAVARLLHEMDSIIDVPGAYARAQWRLHRALIEAGDNPIYGLVLNSFEAFYGRIARWYFEEAVARAAADGLWGKLYEAVQNDDPETAAVHMADYMDKLRRDWPGERIQEWITTYGWHSNTEGDDDDDINDD